MRHATSNAGPAGTEEYGGGRRWPATAAVFVAAAGLVAIAAPAGASAAPAAAPANSFAQTNLIANKASFKPKLVDKNLVNAWGLTAGPSTPIWVSDNNSGFATVYGGGIKGSVVSLDLTVPVPGGNPTGQVFNSSSRLPRRRAWRGPGRLHRGHGLDRRHPVARPDRGLGRRRLVRRRDQPEGRPRR